MPKTYYDDILRFYVHLTYRNSCSISCFKTEEDKKKCTNDNQCDGVEQYGHSNATIFSRAPDTDSNHSNIFSILSECGRVFFSLPFVIGHCLCRQATQFNLVSGCLLRHKWWFVCFISISVEPFYDIYSPYHRSHLSENSNTHQNELIKKMKALLIRKSKLTQEHNCKINFYLFYGVRHTHR